MAMARAAEEHGDHPLFVLERGEITESEFRDRIERHLEAGFDLEPPAHPLLRPPAIPTAR